MRCRAWTPRDVLRVPLRAGLEQVDVGREAHLRDRRLEGVLADDERGVGRRHDALEHRDVTDGMHGTTTAPTFSVPRTISSQSTVVPETTITRSPALIPASRSVVAQTAAPSAISWKFRCSMTPSLPSEVSARRFGSRASASTTSRVKLNRSGICQRPSTSAGFRASSSGDRATSLSRPRRRPIRRPFTASPLSTRIPDC